MVSQQQKNYDSLSLHNVPPQLGELIRRWVFEGREFYLGPENIFRFRGLSIVLENAERISAEPRSWYAHTPKCKIHMPLRKDEIEEVQYELIKSTLPRTAQLDVDHKCNLNCRMCIYHGEMSSFYRKRYNKLRISLGQDVIFRRIKKLRNMGMERLFIGASGEFFLRKDWEELWKYSISMGFKIFVVTNGTLLTPDEIARIARYSMQIEDIIVSLNAHTLEMWRKVNGSNNAAFFETARQAVETLARHALPVTASFVITDANVEEVEVFTHYWNDRGASVLLYNEIPARFLIEDDPRIDNSIWPYYSCANVNGSLMISADGNIAPCCRIIYCFDDDKSFDIPLVNIDEPIDIIKEKWDTILREKSYENICKTCSWFKLRTDATPKYMRIFGHKGFIDPWGAIHISRKKSLPLKIRLEARRFIRRLGKSKLGGAESVGGVRS